MFSQLLRALSGPAPVPATPPAQVALAALMVRLARADGQYAPAEAARIDSLLTARCGLSPAAAAATRAEAERMEAQAADAVRFTRAIKDAIPPEARTGVMEALWAVALADGGRDADEEGMMRLLANLLGVADQDSALARQRVQARTANGGPTA